MRRLNSILIRVSLCLCVAVAVAGGVMYAAETPIPEAPTQWVTDTAGFLSPQAASSLNSQLEEYERSSHHQLIVYIGETTGDAPIEDWAVRAFKKWKVGRKGIDDGLVLFIMAKDQKLRFEVGYGLESVVPDATAFRIIDDVIIPRIRAGDRDGAVTAGMDAAMTVIGGGSVPSPVAEPGTQRASRRDQRPMTLGQMIIFGIIGLVVLIIFITNPSLALYLLVSLLSGGGNRRDGGWGGGGGGGFGGGGGRSGGGGASGSW